MFLLFSVLFLHISLFLIIFSLAPINSENNYSTTLLIATKLCQIFYFKNINYYILKKVNCKIFLKNGI